MYIIETSRAESTKRPEEKMEIINNSLSLKRWRSVKLGTYITMGPIDSSFCRELAHFACKQEERVRLNTLRPYNMILSVQRLALHQNEVEFLQQFIGAIIISLTALYDNVQVA